MTTRTLPTRTTNTKTIKTSNRTIETTTDIYFLLDYQQGQRKNIGHPGQEGQTGHHQRGQPRQNS